MINRLLSRLLFWAIKNKQFSSKETACLAIAALKDSVMDMEDRSLCTSALLEGLNTLPTKSIIETNEQGILFVNGREIDSDKLLQLQQGARAILNSSTRKLVQEQVTYAAVEMIVHKGLTPEQAYFGKAAIWFMKEEETFYRKLLGTE